jgi:hypothetical protein
MTGAMAWRERGSIEIKGIGWIIAGRIPGAILGVFLLGIATTRFLDAFIGLVVLGAVVIIGTGVHLNRTPVTKTIAGIASGTTGVVGSIGGPPIALIYSNEEAHTIRSTLAAVFTIGVLISTVFRWAGGHITMRDTQVAAVLFPAVVVGLYVAERVRDRISREHVRIAILIICAVAATALLVRAAVG